MSWVSTFPQRFAELVNDAPYREVGERLGISKATVGAYLNGKREPKKPVLQSIAHSYGVNPLWLLGMDAPKYAAAAPSPDFYAKAGLEPIPATNKVPRVGGIACGTPILAQENIECYDDIPSWIKCDFTLICHGDSMIGARIFDGDVVCIHQQPEVENGEIAAVMVDDDTATLKRVRRFDDHIVLEPENPSHRPQAFWDADMARVRILGKATHFFSTVR